MGRPRMKTRRSKLLETSRRADVSQCGIRTRWGRGCAQGYQRIAIGQELLGLFKKEYQWNAICSVSLRLVPFASLPPPPPRNVPSPQGS